MQFAAQYLCCNLSFEASVNLFKMVRKISFANNLSEFIDRVAINSGSRHCVHVNTNIEVQKCCNHRPQNARLVILSF